MLHVCVAITNGAPPNCSNNQFKLNDIYVMNVINAEYTKKVRKKRDHIELTNSSKTPRNLLSQFVLTLQSPETAAL